MLRAYFGDSFSVTFTVDDLTYRKPLTLADLNNFKRLTLDELNDPEASFTELNDYKLFTAADLKNLKHFSLPDRNNPQAFRRLIAKQLLLAIDDSLVIDELLELQDRLDADAEEQGVDLSELPELLKLHQVLDEATQAASQPVDAATWEAKLEAQWKAQEALDEALWQEKLKRHGTQIEEAESFARAIEA